MLPFLGKEETQLRRLESQLQQRDCQISNVEASLAKAKAVVEKLKSDVDHLRNALREATTKNFQQEQQIERYNKELKSKKEMCSWLQEQVTYLKKEMENRNEKERDVANKVHHKTEETDRLKAELQAAKRELDHVKASLQSSDLHACRFRTEVQTEMERLKRELALKTQAMQLLEDSVKDTELTEEQKKQLQKAASYGQLSAEMKECEANLKATRANVQELEEQLRNAQFQKGELEKANEEKQSAMEECKRLGGRLDETRSFAKRIDDLEAKKKSLSEAVHSAEQQTEMQNQQIRELMLKLEAKEIKGDAFEASTTELRAELQRKEQELSGMQAHCEHLNEENSKLYEHVSYTQDQLEKAKEVIDAKQGILENERAMSDGDKRNRESVGKLMQGLRSELGSSRRQIVELTTKDKKAEDAIQALERKVEQLRTEGNQLHLQNQFLDKELKSSQAEILRVQQELNGMTEKMARYKSRFACLKEELSESERTVNEQGSRASRLPKCPEYYTLQERVRMLEEEIVAERNSHSVTKNMLRQESEHQATQTGTTHVSTPFPHPGTNFRFSYCRGDPAQMDHDTPRVSFATNAKQGGDIPVASATTVNQPDAIATVDLRTETSKDSISLTPVTEAEQKQETDDGAMDVDDVDQLRASVHFLTPGPKFFNQNQNEKEGRREGAHLSGATSNRRATLDFHQLSSQVFHEYGEKSEKK